MLSRWNATWQQLGVNAPEHAYDHLIAAYAEPHRRYHTTQHLAEVFAFYDSVAPAVGKSPLVELAVWFHDVVYNTRATNNEAASAAYATQVLVAAGLPSAACREVSNLIFATRHDSLATSPGEQLLLDVDLSILGAEPARFAEYEIQIRREYEWVPEQQFRTTRSAILQQFLARKFIFQVPEIRGRLELRARENLASSIAELQSPK